MNYSTYSLRKTREYILQAIEGLSDAQLNLTPPYFSNNIIWNLGHMLAAEQGICYRRAGQPMYIDEAFWEAYKPGSAPGQPVSSEEISSIRKQLLESPDRLEADYAAGKLGAYPVWTTRYGADIKSIDEALAFLLYHEGLHGGCIMALKRTVTALQPA